MKPATQPRIRFTALASKRKMSWVKKIAECYLKDSSRWCDNQILIDSLHFGAMNVKRKRETDGTFVLYDVMYITIYKDKHVKSLFNAFKF